MARLVITIQVAEHVTEQIKLKGVLDKRPLSSPVQIKVDGELYLATIVDYEEKS
jgi:hypothetical protein